MPPPVDGLDSLTEYAENLLRIHRRRPSSSNSIGSAGSEVRCCCRTANCESLAHNEALLGELETNVQTAAQLGQALLLRHEASLAEAEKDRLRMTGTITSLERRNKELEMENSYTIESNRTLLNTLEDLNSSVTQADSRVRDLTTDLDATRAELDRATARAARTEILEAQLSFLEAEQEDLRRNLATTRDEERSAVVRWQKVERLAAELTEQCERIEREYIQEKMRSQKLAVKLEQRKLVREPTTVTSTVDRVAVSNFMKEILADNAQLQAGTTELRQLLVIAQDEIGALREGLMQHQPINSFDERSLSQEFDAASPQLHVHHYYHKEKTAPKKAKKRTTSNARKETYGTSPRRASNIQMVAEEISPTLGNKRWSVQSSAFNSTHSRSSSFPASYFPDTPTSAYQEGSIFDRAYTIESSRPTSAGSERELNMNEMMTPYSPNVNERDSYRRRRKQHKRHSSSFSGPPFSVLNADDTPSTLLESDETEEPQTINENEETQFVQSPPIEEEPEDDSSSDNPTGPSPYLATTIPGRKLVRSTSCESLLAPETAPILPSYRSKRGAPFMVSSSSTTFASPQAILTSATARNTPVGYGSSTYNRLLLTQAAHGGKSGAGSKSPQPERPGKGWFWTRFSSSKDVTATNPTSSSLSKHVQSLNADAESINSQRSKADSGSVKSGKSSSGMVPTIGSLGKTSSSMAVVTTEIDDALLRETLNDEINPEFLQV